MVLGKDKVAVVIGCAGVGIPRSVTLGLAATGAHVVAVDLPSCEEAALKVAEEVRAAGGAIDFFAADAADIDVMRPIIRKAHEFGPIAALVCVAGKAERDDKKFLDAVDPIRRFEVSIRINTLTALVPIYLTLPYMLADGGGKIFTLDSLNSVAPLGQPFYVLGKSPLRQMCRLISHQYAPFGIRTYNLVVGTTPSDKESWLDRFSEFPDLRRALEWVYATNRLGDPDDVAKLIVNFAVNDFWTTGVDLDLTGGFLGVPLAENDGVQATVMKIYDAVHSSRVCLPVEVHADPAIAVWSI